MKTSAFSGFYKLNRQERIREVQAFSNLDEKDAALLSRPDPLDYEIAERMIENVIGMYSLPFAVAVNFLINNKEYVVPMVLEEPSVVAAASNAAKMTRAGGGISSVLLSNLMRAQIQLIDIQAPHAAKFQILSHKKEILDLANAQDSILTSKGGGAIDLEVHTLKTIKGDMIIVHLIVDTKDAMGANTVNTMAEAVAPLLEQITRGKVLLRILSNLADLRVVRAHTLVPKDALGGEEIVDGIVTAFAFAWEDPYRAATHNKGIMNGVDAVVLATGNDFRAVEAGAHSYAARTGRYRPLSVWEKNKDGDLEGYLEMPMAVGIVGGATKTHPMAQLALKIMNISTSKKLAEVIGAVGLAQNLAALKVLATEGVQRGHMELHARNIAVMAGAKGEQIDKLAEILVKEKKVRLDFAIEMLKKI